MVDSQDNQATDNLGSIYSAIVDYHNNLVHMRFTVAGLFLAANGFLVGGLYSSSTSPMPWYALPVLGIALAAICWLLEIRTYHLLANLGARGKLLEKKLGIARDYGFFSLMESQTIPPRLLVTRIKLPINGFVRYTVSHSFGVGILYGVVWLFWVFAILQHV